MINKQNLFAIFAAISISALPLHAAEEKELAADKELCIIEPAQVLEAAQELGQADQEEKCVDLYKEGIHALKRSGMVEENSPILQAFKKMYINLLPGPLTLLWRLAFPSSRPENPARQVYPYPTYNFDLFKIHPELEVNWGTIFQVILDKNSKDKNGQPLLSVAPSTWLNNPTIQNSENISMIGWEYSPDEDGIDSVTLKFCAKQKGTSRFILDNNGGFFDQTFPFNIVVEQVEKPQYWVDFVIE